MSRLILLQALALLVLPGAASAGVLGASGSCNATEEAEVNCVAYGTPPAGVTWASSATSGIASAAYSIRTNYGNLGIYLAADTAKGFGETRASAVAVASSVYWDEVTAVHGFAAAGTPFTATYHMFIDGRARGEATRVDGVMASSLAFVRAQFMVYSDTRGPLASLTACSATLPELVSGCDSAYAGERADYVFSFEAFAGEKLTVFGSLQGGVDVRVDADSFVSEFPANTARVNSLHSLHTYLSAPGANFVGSTGHDYAAPVPEPGARALTLAGLAAVATLAVARRRRDVRQA